MNDPVPNPATADAESPRPAASLVLLRDAPGGLQVLLLKRPGEDRVLAGAHVFPGGKLDREDADDDTLSRFDVDPQDLHARLGEPELDVRQAAALHIAAVREAFEETGVLLARDIDEPLAGRARAMRREGLTFGELLEALDLRLDASLMRPWSRWITPKAPAMMRRRFDTRFFVARLPRGQQAVHDPSEAVAADWMDPRDALRRYWTQEISLAAPQIMTLAHLARLADVGAALQEASGRLPPTIRPHAVQTPEGRAVCYPGDAEHPQRERVMPGPTRLMFENDRFRPVGGFEAWFD
jgi:8-oxo-dGTP pyrophosphatase MutT (NUDIX family)